MVPPRGHIEFGEAIFSTAKREAKEEVGLNVTPIGIFSINENVPKDPNKRHFLLFHIICSTDSNNVNIHTNELAEYTWATLNKSLNILHNNIYCKILFEYFKQLKLGKINWVFTPS